MDNEEPLTADENTNAWLDAARLLGIDYLVIDKEHGYAKLYQGEKILYVQSNLLSLNDNVAVSNSRSLFLTLKLLEVGGCPVPPYLHLFSKKGFREAENINAIFDFTENKYPVVFGSDKKIRRKPVRVSNDEELGKTLLELRDSSIRRLLVTPVPSWPLYKALVYDESIIRINKIELAFLQGDGINTIDKLFLEFNAKHRISSGIKLSKSYFETNYLSANNLEWSSVMENNQALLLDKEWFNGYGISKPFNQTSISSDVRSLLIRAANATRLKLAELDYYSPDINDPKNEGYFYAASGLPALTTSPRQLEHNESLKVRTDILQQFFSK